MTTGTSAERARHIVHDAERHRDPREVSGPFDRRAEVEEKLDRVRAWLDETDRDAVLLSSQPDFAWITGGGDNRVAVDARDGVAAVLVTRDTAFLLTTNIELGRLLDEEVPGLPFEAVPHPWHQPPRAAQTLRRLCDHGRAVSDTGALGLPEVEPELAPLRHTLLPPEIERFRALGVDAAEAVERACLTARPGDTELDVAAVAAVAAAECTRRGIVPLVDLVAADERIAAYRHPLPTRNRLRRTLLVALTGRRHGLHASLTRMVSLGGPTATWPPAMPRCCAWMPG